MFVLELPVIKGLISDGLLKGLRAEACVNCTPVLDGCFSASGLLITVSFALELGRENKAFQIQCVSHRKPVYEHGFSF